MVKQVQAQMFWSQLHMLCLESKPFPPQELEKYKYYVNSCTESDNTPLHFVALSGNMEIAWYLISSGANFTPNNSLETPLHWACKSGKENIVELYLKAGAYANAKDVDGNTPLHWAAENNYPRIVALLLNHSGCNISAKNEDGFTSIELACLSDASESFLVLLENGASTERCIQMVIEYNCPEVACILVDYGICIRELTVPMLTLAKENQSLDILKILYRADLKAPKKKQYLTTPRKVVHRLLPTNQFVSSAF